jgi:alkaline phosphatase D
MTRPLYPLQESGSTNRRSFLVATTSLAAAALWSSRSVGAVQGNPVFSDYPFALGVASGDPAPDGVVLWTRLAPKPLEGGGMPPELVEVSWRFAEDEAMTRVVRAGTTVATPDWAHSVHVEVDGLQPGHGYWYQFRAGKEVSPKGRTKTTPPADSAPASLRFAFASCQHFEQGYFTALEHLAREDLDLAVHLGDYIYEYAGKEKAVRKHAGHEINSIDDYRNRHAQYKMEQALQAAHAAFPWIVTWDDHELDNNYAGAISEEKGVSPEALLMRRARAYQAYYEHMPLRRSALPDGPDMLLYRRIAFGRLAEFFVLDTRQYRTDQPCGDGNKPPCAAVYDPQATLLGAPQRRWLLDGLGTSAARWNVLAQQVMMARVDVGVGERLAYSMDQWPGYESERRYLLKWLDERRVKNPVVLAGDIHENWANDLVVDFDSPGSKTVATEFVGTSITSGGDGSNVPKGLDRLLSKNPFVKFHNNERGYVRCEVTPGLWRTDYQTVAYVTRPGAPLLTRASFVVEEGQPGLKNG